VTIYPEVGEATGAHVRVGEDDEPDDEYGNGSGWGSMSRDLRKTLNLDRARRRARSKLRRYAVRNQLRVLWTLTYRCTACQVPTGCICGLKQQPASRAEVRGHVNRFASRLRESLGVDAFPYAYVVERGTQGTQRLHVHVLLAPGFDPEVMHAAWGHGTVDVKYRADGVGGREGARKAAAYAAKYVGKSLGDEDPAWAHSYERSQGFNVREVKVRTLEVWDAYRLAAEGLGGGPVDLSVSLDWEDYYGPPAWSMQAT
jgi:hypothetical protein